MVRQDPEKKGKEKKNKRKEIGTESKTNNNTIDDLCAKKKKSLVEKRLEL